MLLNSLKKIITLWHYSFYFFHHWRWYVAIFFLAEDNTWTTVVGMTQKCSSHASVSNKLNRIHHLIYALEMLRSELFFWFSLFSISTSMVRLFQRVDAIACFTVELQRNTSVTITWKNTDMFVFCFPTRLLQGLWFTIVASWVVTS